MAQQATPNTKHAGKRLLIADDDTDMRLLLAEYFRRLGFQVEEHESGVQHSKPPSRDDSIVSSSTYRCPACPVIELLKRVRDRGIQTPALFLTAHDALSDKVAGFEAGADDYLAKPFSPRELEYRVEALLRRGGQAPPEPDGERIEVGDLVIDKRRHEVMRNGFRVDLTPLEFQILELLASEPGRAWSRNALLDRVWSTDYEGYQRNIDPHINRLRKKLKERSEKSAICPDCSWCRLQAERDSLMLWWVGSGLNTRLANPPVRQTDGLDPDVATLWDLRPDHPNCRLPEKKERTQIAAVSS